MGDIELVEPSRSKDGSDKQALNFLMAYDRANPVPLVYVEYPRSFVNMSHPQMMLERASANGCATMTFWPW